MAIRHTNTVAGAALILGGGAVALLSLQIGRGPAMNTLPASFFPLLCAAGLALAGLVLFVRGLRAPPEPLPALLEPRVLALGGLMALYFGTFQHMDFRLGSWLFALLAMLILGNRSIPQLVIVPVAVTAGIYVTFRYLFTILLPVWS
ncbi:MAG TPA: tripartite tricarboxylate transporter TctB family protein [Afifellaceae bacterium]|nr:tripartite tricarboxylate transporter TctB family protein [Afifellaceae bacterium]